MTELLSVIVPIYRVEKYLDRCLRSIVNQTYKNLEIILIDDGSDDSCPEICDEWGRMDSRITVIHKQNEGLVAARKTGLKNAHADYIGYVDSDDWLEPDFYEMLMDKMNLYDCDMVCSGRIEEYESESRVCKNRIEEGLYTGKSLREKLISNMLCNDQGMLFNLWPTVWDKVFKKNLLYDAQMNVPELITTGEDLACTYPAVLRAKSVYVSNECKYHYNKIRNDSMLRKRDNQYFMRLHILQKYLSEIFETSIYADELRVPLNEYVYSQASYGIWHEYGVTKHVFKVKNNVNKNVRPAKTYFFPYEMVPSKSNVVIYGAGKIGKQFMQQIDNNKYCNVVKWIDKINDNVTVFSVESLTNLDFDFLIIAVAKKDYVKEIVETLENFQIDKSKIIWKADYGIIMNG